MRKLHLKYLSFALVCFSFTACQAPEPRVVAAAGDALATATTTDALSTSAPEVAHTFMDLSYDRVRALGVSPPAASRIYAYVGLSLYEASRFAAKEASYSFTERLVGLEVLPTPSSQPHDWRLCAASAAYVVITSLLADADTEAEAWSLLLAEDESAEKRNVSAKTRSRSFDFGYALGEALVAYAGDDGFTATRGKPFTPPIGDDKWVPTGPVTNPVEPHWGTLRGFAIFDRTRCVCPPPRTFATTADSAFYAQALATRDAVSSASIEQQTIARFWADSPKETGTPPGHWLKITGLVTREQNLGLVGTSFVYASVQMAIADAFILGWNEKYTYNLLRPVTYIQRYIDPSWQPLLQTPPFPEYISGHSVGSAAAAGLLTAFFGDAYAFTDTTASARGFAPRSFSSFNEAAREAALSRLYGGIHYPMGNQEGLLLGECVGDALIDALVD